jgi:Tfp pilus assembly protein PilO
MLSLSIANLKLPAWLRENKRIRTSVLVCAGLICADLLLYALLLAPAEGRLRSGEEKYAELRKRHTEAVLFEKHKKDFAGIRAGIPTQKDMPILVKDLVQTARRLKLSVSSITYDIPKRSGQELAILSFSFPAGGRYSDIKRFIYEIETSGRLVGIRDLKLQKDRGRVALQMSLVTYVKGQ